MNQPSTRTPIDPADIRIGDLIRRENWEGKGNPVQAIEYRATEAGDMRVGWHPKDAFFLLDRTPEPDEAERARIADILDDHVKIGRKPTHEISVERRSEFYKLDNVLGGSGGPAGEILSGVVAWLRGGARDYR